MRHAILQTDDETVPRQNGLDHLGHPLRVIGLDDEKDEVEFFLDLGDLAEISAGTLALIVRASRLTVVPFSRMASTWAAHCSIKVTSNPAKAKSAPIEAP